MALTPQDRATILRASGKLHEARTPDEKRVAVADLTDAQLRSVAASLWIDPDEAKDRDDLIERISRQVTTSDILEGIDGSRRSGGSDKLHALAAERVAARWDVGQQDMETLLRESKQWDSLGGMSLEEQKRTFLAAAFFAYDGGAYGSPPLIMAMASASRAHGIDFTPRLGEQGFIDFAARDPAFQRAIDGLGAAIYDNTQDWFRERGTSPAPRTRSGATCTGPGRCQVVANSTSHSATNTSTSRTTSRWTGSSRSHPPDQEAPKRPRLSFCPTRAR
jgi:hypothetical protein